MEKLGNVPKGPELVGDGVGFRSHMTPCFAACPGCLWLSLAQELLSKPLHFEGHLNNDGCHYLEVQIGQKT